MKSKYQFFSEQLSELEETLSNDEPEFLRLEKEYNKKQEEFNHWKERYNEEAGTVVQKYFIVGIIFVLVFFGNLIFQFITVSQPWVALCILALPFVIGFFITWEDRDSRNSSENLMKKAEKEFLIIKPTYENLKSKYDKEKKQYEDLKEKFSTWTDEREKLLRDLAGRKPYQYFGFPLDPIIDSDYYPLGTIEEPKKYMVYTAHAYRYHKKRGCSGAWEEISISEALDKKMSPCLNCVGYACDFDYPDWVHTVRDKYLNLVIELEKYDISAFIDSNQQLSVAIPIIEDLDKKTIPSTDTSPKNKNQNSTEAKLTTYKGIYNSPSYRNLLHFHYGLSYEEIEQRAQQEARKQRESLSTKQSIDHKQAPSFSSEPMQSTVDSQILRDAFGNNKSDADTDKKGPSTAVAIAMLVACIVTAFIVIVFAISVFPKKETPSPHTHEYHNGLCTCSAVDEAYCSPIFESILSIMSDMSSPTKDLETIEEKLALLPPRYRSTASISYQEYNLQIYCDILDRELNREDPDNQTIDYAFRELGILQDKSVYSSWNIQNIIRFYSNLQKKNHPYNTDTHIGNVAFDSEPETETETALETEPDPETEPENVLCRLAKSFCLSIKAER